MRNDVFISHSPFLIPHISFLINKKRYLAKIIAIKFAGYEKNAYLCSR